MSKFFGISVKYCSTDIILQVCFKNCGNKIATTLKGMIVNLNAYYSLLFATIMHTDLDKDICVLATSNCPWTSSNGVIQWYM